MIEVDGLEEEYTPEDLVAINAWFEGKNLIPVPEDMYLCPFLIKDTVENV